MTYTDAASDTAVVIQVMDTDKLTDVETAVRTLVTIAGPEAPLQFEFPLEVPDGGQVQLQPDGSVAIVTPEGQALGIFAAPWAVDASGADIPTWFEIAGSKLIQHVQHTGAIYPVIADPVFLVPVLIVGARVAAQVAVRASTASAARSAAVRAAASQTGKKGIRAVGNAKKVNFRSYTRSNSRHNLVARTGRNPKNCQAHHTMPVVLASYFLANGINIHDPTYLTWWNSTPGLLNNHGSLAKAYNNEWHRFRDANPRATKTQILNKRAALHRKYMKYYRC